MQAGFFFLVYTKEVITLIFGENTYERDQQLKRLVGNTNEIARLSAEVIDAGVIQQVLYGASLFSSQSTTVIDELSENKVAWDLLGKALEQDRGVEAQVVLLETKPDKRTKVYKLLQKKAKVIECKPFSDKNPNTAVAWLKKYAAEHTIVVDAAAATEIVRRIGVEQYALVNEIQRLSLLGTITLDTVKSYTPDISQDTAFSLLSMAIKGDAVGVQNKIRVLQRTEDAYRVQGLIISQVYMLAALYYGEGNDSIATEIGVHPYALNQLQAIAKALTEQKLKAVVDRVAVIDTQLKTTSIDPWLAIEVSLTSIAE